MRNETKCITRSQQMTLEHTVSWRVFDPDNKNPKSTNEKGNDCQKTISHYYPFKGTVTIEMVCSLIPSYLGYRKDFFMLCQYLLS
jgi:hypothetical protein